MPVQASGVIIFRSANFLIEYLLLQASYGTFHWSPPKGHVDEGETHLATAKRETAEETGLKPSDYEIVPGFEKNLTYQAGDKLKTVTFWLGKMIYYDLSITLSDEHKAYKWVSIDDAEKLIQHESLINFMKDVHEFLCSHGYKDN